MGRKKIAMFFGKKRQEPDPFWDFGNKRSVYYDFFELGLKLGHDVFLANGRQTYEEGLVFRDLLKYSGSERFKLIEGDVEVDVVYDKSGGVKFPTAEISNKVINSIEFKRLCFDKHEMYMFLGDDFMKKTYLAENEREFSCILQKLPKNETYFLKPTNGLGGKGIFFGNPQELENLAKEIDFKARYVLQEFIDTSSGISGLVKGLHDLRVVFVGGKVVWSHVRTPKKGSMLSNVSQGGNIKEIDISQIPKCIQEKVFLIQEKITKKFGNQIYSVDFGVESAVPYVFELNDQIGFPTEKMKKKNLFLNSLWEELIIKSRA